jgi:hypothetical protein
LPQLFLLGLAVVQGMDWAGARLCAAVWKIFGLGAGAWARKVKEKVVAGQVNQKNVNEFRTGSNPA